MESPDKHWKRFPDFYDGYSRKRGEKRARQFFLFFLVVYVAQFLRQLKSRGSHLRMFIRYTFAEAEAIITARTRRDHGIRFDASSIFHANKSELSYPDIAFALVMDPTLNFLNAPGVYYRVPIAAARVEDDFCAHIEIPGTLHCHSCT